MPRSSTKFTATHELQVLSFWAQAMDIERTFSPEAIDSIPGLKEAIDAVRKLPDAIGWGNEHPTRRPIAGRSSEPASRSRRARRSK